MFPHNLVHREKDVVMVTIKIVCIGFLLHIGALCGPIENISNVEEHKANDESKSTQSPEKAIVQFGELFAEMGNELTPTQTQNEPKVSWNFEKDTLYTLVMLDPDVSSSSNATRNPYPHLLYVDIPGNEVSAGTTVFDYIGAGPQLGDGIHRYMIEVYRQSTKLDPTSIASIKDEVITDRVVFSFDEFKEKYTLGSPIASNFFRAQYDDYVPILYEKLKEKYHL